jgi:hypothetical protein
VVSALVTEIPSGREDQRLALPKEVKPYGRDVSLPLVAAYFAPAATEMLMWVGTSWVYLPKTPMEETRGVPIDEAWWAPVPRLRELRGRG